jgi:hypothetical protein
MMYCRRLLWAAPIAAVVGCDLPTIQVGGGRRDAAVEKAVIQTATAVEAVADSTRAIQATVENLTKTVEVVVQRLDDQERRLSELERQVKDAGALLSSSTKTSHKVAVGDKGASQTSKEAAAEAQRAEVIYRGVDVIKVTVTSPFEATTKISVALPSDGRPVEVTCPTTSRVFGCRLVR